MRNLTIAYKDVFLSPLDYDLNMSDVRLADLRELDGQEPTDRQKAARLRLERLTELGGIDSNLLPSEFAYQLEKS